MISVLHDKYWRIHGLADEWSVAPIAIAKAAAELGVQVWIPFAHRRLVPEGRLRELDAMREEEGDAAVFERLGAPVCGWGALPDGREGSMSATEILALPAAGGAVQSGYGTTFAAIRCAPAPADPRDAPDPGDSRLAPGPFAVIRHNLPSLAGRPVQGLWDAYGAKLHLETAGAKAVAKRMGVEMPAQSQQVSQPVPVAGQSRRPVGALGVVRERTLHRTIAALVIMLHDKAPAPPGKRKRPSIDEFAASLAPKLEAVANEFRKGRPMPGKFGLGDDCARDTLKAALAAISEDDWYPDPK